MDHGHGAGRHGCGAHPHRRRSGGVGHVPARKGCEYDQWQPPPTTGSLAATHTSTPFLSRFNNSFPTGSNRDPVSLTQGSGSKRVMFGALPWPQSHEHLTSIIPVVSLPTTARQLQRRENVTYALACKQGTVQCWRHHCGGIPDPGTPSRGARELSPGGRSHFPERCSPQGGKATTRRPRGWQPALGKGSSPLPYTEPRITSICRRIASTCKPLSFSGRLRRVEKQGYCWPKASAFWRKMEDQLVRPATLHLVRAPGSTFGTSAAAYGPYGEKPRTFRSSAAVFEFGV